MENYTCIRSFRSAEGIQFNYGKSIPLNIYAQLRVDEKRNFNKIEEENYSSSNTSEESTDSFTTYLSDTIFDSHSDFGSSDISPDSGSSFDGFGGGDFGGGGSSDSW